MSWRDEPIVSMWRLTWKYSYGNRHNVVLYVFLSVVANCILALTPLLVAWLLNTVQEEGFTNPTKLAWIVLLFLAMQLVFWAFHGPSRVIETKNAFIARANYKKHLVAGVLALPAAWHVEHHSGDTIDRIEKSTQALYRFACNTFEITEAVVRLVTSFIALAIFNLTSVYLVTFCLLVAGFVVYRFDKHLRIGYRKVNAAENRTAAKVFDSISNITTILILRVERLVHKGIVRSIDEPEEQHAYNQRKQEVKWFLVSMLVSLTTVLVLASYLLQLWWLGGALLVGTVYILYGYADRLGGVLFRFAARYGDIVQNKAAVDNVEPIESLFPAEGTIDRTAERWTRIEIEHLSFTYESASGITHLDDISLSIARGERIALIGESGSGKTTFLKLLRGLYEPQQGVVRIDGVVSKEGLTPIQPSVALIPQEPELFNATIRDNITMGVAYDHKDVERAVALAQFTAVIKRLPHGYDSLIHEKGVNLSGGEKQRLALARGLLASMDKELILLDEPTSSVDARNELLIYQGILSAFKKEAVVSTVHRLHMLDRFDTIYLFSRGKIVARGTLAELKRSSPAFQRLWKKYHSKAKKE